MPTQNLVGIVLQLVEPQEATQEMLRDVHTEEYLLSVNESGTRLAEVQLWADMMRAGSHVAGTECTFCFMCGLRDCTAAC